MYLKMKHLGDIRNIDGSAIEIPDIVCGGSPCQDLSVAGKRAGFEGERSGLFYEYIRVVKELRESSARNLRTTNTGLIKPRYMVLENVPGLYSSAEGKDFQACLTEIIRIVQPNAPDVPKPDRGGWSKSGWLSGMGASGCPFSVAWRMHDAQFWRVPQRRKRVCVLVDFNGLTAPKILFDSELRGASDEGGTLLLE